MRSVDLEELSINLTHDSINTFELKQMEHRRRSAVRTHNASGTVIGSSNNRLDDICHFEARRTNSNPNTRRKTTPNCDMCSTTEWRKHKQGRSTSGNVSVISFYNVVTVLTANLAVGLKHGEPDLVYATTLTPTNTRKYWLANLAANIS